MISKTMSDNLSHFIRSTGVDPVAAFAAFFSPIDEELADEFNISAKPANRRRFIATVDLYNQMFDKVYRPDLPSLRNLYNFYGVQIAALRNKSADQLRQCLRSIGDWQHYYDCVRNVIMLHNPTDQVVALRNVEPDDLNLISPETKGTGHRRHNQKKITKILMAEERYKMRKIAQPFTFIYNGHEVRVLQRHFQMPLKDAAVELDTTTNKLSIAWANYCDTNFKRRYRWPGTFLDYDKEVLRDEETEDLA